jgi:hypothetical protein
MILPKLVRRRRDRASYHNHGQSAHRKTDVDPMWGGRCLELLQQTESVKDYSEKVLQLIVKVCNIVTEKDKLRRYMKGLKRSTVVRVGIVCGRYKIFAHVKGAGETLEFELWRSRRKTNTAGSFNHLEGHEVHHWASSSSAANHKRQGAIRYL